MKQKWIKMYLDIAVRISQESHAKRLKVGAVFVSPSGVVSTGINGLPAGGSNECEDEFGNTKPEVAHAEESVMSKLLQQGVSTLNGTFFLTHSPCSNCAKLLANAGIKEIYYLEEYRDTRSLDYLKAEPFNIKIVKFEG